MILRREANMAICIERNNKYDNYFCRKFKARRVKLKRKDNRGVCAAASLIVNQAAYRQRYEARPARVKNQMRKRAQYKYIQARA